MLAVAWRRPAFLLQFVRYRVAGFDHPVNRLAYKLNKVKRVHEYARKTPAVSRVRRQHDLPKTPFEYVRVCLDADLFRGRLCRSSPTEAERHSRLKKPSTATVM